MEQINIKANKHYHTYLVLLLTYFFCRLLFKNIVILKQGFIYPTGKIVELFYGSGQYLNGEWLFYMNPTQFILDESCSGTTFFSLLTSYIIYRIIKDKIYMYWLIFIYPVTLIANSMRVLSSIYAHDFTILLKADYISDQVHVITGVIAFLCSFLMIVYLIDNKEQKK